MLAISLLEHIFIRNPDNERRKRNRKVVQEGNRVWCKILVLKSGARETMLLTICVNKWRRKMITDMDMSI